MSVYTEFTDETIRLAEERAKRIGPAFLEEVGRLLKSGAVDLDDHHRGLLFGVAMMNLAQDYLPAGYTKMEDYKNLRKF